MGSDNRRFVQFPHPGGEHSPDYGDWKAWNPTSKDHARKFVEVGGAWVNGPNSAATQKGKLWAWAEWEAESRVLHRFKPSQKGMPNFLWECSHRPKADYQGLRNTDPFIYDGFYYTNCKQDRLPGLRRLGQGSVIAFGSKVNARWVVDTVFVVADHVDHSVGDYDQRLAEWIPESLRRATLDTYQNYDPSWQRRCYAGATWNNPVDEMFSFFPCLPAARNTPFERPYIELPSKYFTPNLAQGAKGCALRADPLSRSMIRELWSSIVEQILSQGVLLGVQAESPIRSTRRGHYHE